MIVARGSPNGTFYLVTHGTVLVRRSAQDSSTPRAAITGDDFGSIGLEGQGTEAMHVTAASDSVAVLAVSREALLEAGSELESVVGDRTPSTSPSTSRSTPNTHPHSRPTLGGG